MRVSDYTSAPICLFKAMRPDHQSQKNALSYFPYLFGALSGLAILLLQAGQLWLPPIFISAPSLVPSVPDWTLAVMPQIVPSGADAWLSAAVITFATTQVMFDARHVRNASPHWPGSLFFVLAQLAFYALSYFLMPAVSRGWGAWIDQLFFFAQQLAFTWIAVHLCLRIPRIQWTEAPPPPPLAMRRRASIMFGALTLLCVLAAWPAVNSAAAYRWADYVLDPAALLLLRDAGWGSILVVVIVAGAGARFGLRYGAARIRPWLMTGLVILGFVLVLLASALVNALVVIESNLKVMDSLFFLLSWKLVCLFLFWSVCAGLSRAWLDERE